MTESQIRFWNRKNPLLDDGAFEEARRRSPEHAVLLEQFREVVSFDSDRSSTAVPQNVVGFAAGVLAVAVVFWLGRDQSIVATNRSLAKQERAIQESEQRPGSEVSSYVQALQILRTESSANVRAQALDTVYAFILRAMRSVGERHRENRWAAKELQDMKAMTTERSDPSIHVARDSKLRLAAVLARFRPGLAVLRREKNRGSSRAATRLRTIASYRGLLVSEIERSTEEKSIEEDTDTSGEAIATSGTISVSNLNRGEEAQIYIKNSSLAGQSIQVAIDDGRGHADSVEIALDSNGNGSATWRVPEWWKLAMFNAGTMHEVKRVVN